MSEAEALSRELAELNARRAAAQLRAKVAAGELMDHLNTLAALAVSGDQQARQLAQQLQNALDGLRSAAAGIAVVHGGGDA